MAILGKKEAFKKPKRRERVVPKHTRMKRLIKLADRLWVKALLIRDHHRCRIPNCNFKQEVLHPHHVFARRHKTVRWLIGNGLILCFTHHRQVHDDAPTIIDEIINQVGHDTYKYLSHLASMIKTDLTEEEMIDTCNLLNRYIEMEGGESE